MDALIETLAMVDRLARAAGGLGALVVVVWVLALIIVLALMAFCAPVREDLD